MKKHNCTITVCILHILAVHIKQILQQQQLLFVVISAFDGESSSTNGFLDTAHWTLLPVKITGDNEFILIIRTVNHDIVGIHHVSCLFFFTRHDSSEAHALIGSLDVVEVTMLWFHFTHLAYSVSQRPYLHFCNQDMMIACNKHMQFPN